MFGYDISRLMIFMHLHSKNLYMRKKIYTISVKEGESDHFPAFVIHICYIYSFRLQGFLYIQPIDD